MNDLKKLQFATITRFGSRFVACSVACLAVACRFLSAAIGIGICTYHSQMRDDGMLELTIDYLLSKPSKKKN